MQVSLERHDAIKACCKNILATGGEAQSILAMVRRGVAIEQVPTHLHHSHVPVVAVLQVLLSCANLGSLLSVHSAGGTTAALWPRYAIFRVGTTV